MYKLNIIATAESNAPPDFLLYVISAHPEIPLEVMGGKFDYEKQENIHILKRFGIKSEIRIVDVTKPSKNNYILKLFIKVKLPLIYESGIGTYHFVNGSGKTLCYGGGNDEIYRGFSELIVRMFRHKIETYFMKMYDEYIKGATKLWNEPDLAEKYLQKSIVEMIQAKSSFDDLLNFEMCIDYLSMFSQNIKGLDDSLKVEIEGCFSILTIKPRTCVVDAGIVVEGIVKKLCPKNWDQKTRYPNNGHPKKWTRKKVWRGSTANFTMYLGDNKMVPEEIIASMNTVRIFRNLANHEDFIVTKTMAMTTLFATLTIAEWYTEQIEFKKLKLKQQN